MTLRAAVKILENLSNSHTDSNDTLNREVAKALENLADGLFQEFVQLHERLDQLKAGQDRLERRLDLIQANKQAL